MRRIAACMVLLIFFAGVSSEKKTVIAQDNPEYETISIEPINNRISTLDSLLIEVRKEYNGKKR